jgi:hypothetical protein
VARRGAVGQRRQTGPADQRHGLKMSAGALHAPQQIMHALCAYSPFLDSTAKESHPSFPAIASVYDRRTVVISVPN